MLTTRYTSKKSSWYDLVVICINKRRIPWISRFYALVKIMLVTLHRDVLVAFKARWPFLAINLEILCNFYKKRCENMLLKILKHSMAGSVTFCCDGCFVKWFQHHRGLTQSQCGVILYESCQWCFMKGLQVLYDFLNQYKVGDGKLH